jgi:hypothetical protein
MSFSTFAACDFSIVNKENPNSTAFQSELTEIMLQKGYNVIDSGDAVEANGGVRADAMTTESGRTIIQISSKYYTSKDGCTKFSDKRVECGVSLAIGQVNDAGVIQSQSQIQLSQFRKATLFTSQDKIAATFKQQVLEQAKAIIPACH